MAAPDLAAQQAVARAIQAQFWQDVPYVPLGEYYRLTAHRRDLVDIPTGSSLFYTVRRTA